MMRTKKIVIALANPNLPISSAIFSSFYYKGVATSSSLAKML